jgi:hypothetical protein
VLCFGRDARWVVIGALSSLRAQIRCAGTLLITLNQAPQKTFKLCWNIWASANEMLKKNEQIRLRLFRGSRVSIENRSYVHEMITWMRHGSKASGLTSTASASELHLQATPRLLCSPSGNFNTSSWPMSPKTRQPIYSRIECSIQ